MFLFLVLAALCLSGSFKASFGSVRFGPCRSGSQITSGPGASLIHCSSPTISVFDASGQRLAGSQHLELETSQIVSEADSPESCNKAIMIIDDGAAG